MRVRDRLDRTPKNALRFKSKPSQVDTPGPWSNLLESLKSSTKSVGQIKVSIPITINLRIISCRSFRLALCVFYFGGFLNWMLAMNTSGVRRIHNQPCQFVSSIHILTLLNISLIILLALWLICCQNTLELHLKCLLSSWTKELRNSKIKLTFKLDWTFKLLEWRF